LADKYAPAAPEVSETLAQLQLPAEKETAEPTDSSYVPLPQRGSTNTGRSQHQIALFISEGRKAIQKLALMPVAGRESRSSRLTLSPVTDTMTTISNTLERDFTVEGKPSKLDCPFTPAPDSNLMAIVGQKGAESVEDKTPHHSADPICAAMHEDAFSGGPAHSANGSTAAKCPIRFMDQHSPEEIAQYVETHKHEIPRSHEVCVRRYQKNEEQIRKLDAKYGNLVSMITDLSQLHKPMLQSGDGHEEEAQDEVEGASNERVENWAQQVVLGDNDEPPLQAASTSAQDDLDRQSHFDRPLKEIRVGESPSRPWGISVPVVAARAAIGSSEIQARDRSPPPAPAHLSSIAITPSPRAAGKGKCPVDHTKFISAMHDSPTQRNLNDAGQQRRPPLVPPHHASIPLVSPPHVNGGVFEPSPSTPLPTTMPAKKDGAGVAEDNRPQMVFTGPVFIGYPTEQAAQFMQQFQKGS
jgi:hypothetical protein